MSVYLCAVIQSITMILGCTCICAYMYMCVRVCAYVLVYVYVYIYVHVYFCAYVFVCLKTSLPLAPRIIEFTTVEFVLTLF